MDAIGMFHLPGPKCLLDHPPNHFRKKKKKTPLPGGLLSFQPSPNGFLGWEVLSQNEKTWKYTYCTLRFPTQICWNYFRCMFKTIPLKGKHKNTKLTKLTILGGCGMSPFGWVPCPWWKKTSFSPSRRTVCCIDYLNKIYGDPLFTETWGGFINKTNSILR